MVLSREDAKLFYKMMWPLQFYVGQQRKIAMDADSPEAYARLPTETKLEVREALYAHIDLIDPFVAENPASLSPDELEIVRSWRHFVQGRFYIERFLKKHSIWINADGPARVYAVLGIVDPIEDILPMSPPILVQAVLLPFKRQIIHDGLIAPYSIFFGGGIKGNLREIYMTAKQNQQIITSLEPEARAAQAEPTPPEPTRDWNTEVAEIVSAAAKLRGEKEPVQAAAFSLLRMAAGFAQAAVQASTDLDTLWKEQQRVQRALNKVQTVLDRAERTL